MPAEILPQSVIAKIKALLRARTALVGPIAAFFALTLSTAARAATITVDSLADPGATGICALRDAITAADTMTAKNGCAAGTGSDTIQFSVTGTVPLTDTLPQITGNLTIKGPASPGITIDGGTTMFGAGVRVMQVTSSAMVKLNGLTIADGSSETKGGGILNDGTLTVTGSTFSHNSTPGFGTPQPNTGGGIFNDGTLTVSNSTFSGNGSLEGGGIFNDGTLTVTNSAFSGAAIEGGGIYNHGRLTVANSTFSENDAEGGAGGIANYGTLAVTNSTFSDNSCNNGFGGGIANNGTLAITNSTFSGNFAPEGGGIFNLGTLIVTNSTFSANSGTFAGGGIASNGTLTVTNSTFSGNTDSQSIGTGGSIFISGGTASLKSAILAGSAPNDNCSGTINDAGYNISDDTSCGFAKTGSANNGDGVNPLLSTDGLADNGGPTETIALTSGSPAIDAIPLAACTDQASPAKPITIDQRGLPRPDAGEDVCDIGAYESQETFAGRPGAANCVGVSVSALTRRFRGIDAAASSLGFRNVKTLQKAIRAFCRS